MGILLKEWKGVSTRTITVLITGTGSSYLFSRIS